MTEQVKLILRDSYAYETFAVETAFKDTYVDSDFRSISANGLLLLTGKFKECDFTGADLSNCLIACTFEECDLSYVDFTGATFRRVQFKGACDLSAIDFSDATGIWQTEIDMRCIINNFKGADIVESLKGDHYKLATIADEGRTAGKLVKANRIKVLGDFTDISDRGPTGHMMGNSFRGTTFHDARQNSWENWEDEWMNGASTPVGMPNYVVRPRHAHLFSSDEKELDEL